MLTEKKKVSPMLARLKKKGKLKGKVSKEDIIKFGTRGEIDFLKEDVYGYQGGNSPAGISEQEAYDEGFEEGQKFVKDELSELLKKLATKSPTTPNVFKILNTIAEEFEIDLER